MVVTHAKNLTTISNIPLQDDYFVYQLSIPYGMFWCVNKKTEVIELHYLYFDDNETWISIRFIWAKSPSQTIYLIWLNFLSHCSIQFILASMFYNMQNLLSVLIKIRVVKKLFINWRFFAGTFKVNFKAMLGYVILNAAC